MLKGDVRNRRTKRGASWERSGAAVGLGQEGAVLAVGAVFQQGRGAQRTAIWFHSGPDDLRMICENECNDIT